VQAIESCLRLVMNGKQNGIPASETAAEGLGFARNWGGRQMRWWARIWMNNQDLLQRIEVVMSKLNHFSMIQQSKPNCELTCSRTNGP